MDSPHFQPSLVDILLREDPHPPPCTSNDFHLHKMLNTVLCLDQILVLWTPCCAVKPQHSYESSQYNFTSLQCDIFWVQNICSDVSFSVLQQNSINLTCMGSHKCQITEYFRSWNGPYLVQTPLQTFLNTSLKSVSMTKLLFGKKLHLGTTLLKYQIARISDLPNIWLKEIFCTKSGLNKQ